MIQHQFVWFSKFQSNPILARLLRVYLLIIILISYQTQIIILIWVSYNISPTWIKAIWGWFPLLTMILVRSQWGRYNLPRLIKPNFNQTQFIILIQLSSMLCLSAASALVKQKKYFTSCDPHHDIYTFSYWQIFWHSIWHIFWHSIWHSIWHIFWHMIWHIFWHIFWHSIWQIFWHSIWHTFWRSIWHIFWNIFWHIYLAYLLAYFLAFYLTNLLALYLTFYLPTWGPAGNTWRGYSRLRSGREHWAGMLVVEVREGTLGGDARGWGPAGNTGRGWSWLRSGREHWAWMVVVEVRQKTLWIADRSWTRTTRTTRRTRRTRRRRRTRQEAAGGRQAEGRRRQLT